LICREKVEGEHKIVPRRLSYYKIMYYRGYICGPNLQKLTPTLDERRVRNLRNHVYSAYEHNVVTLVQKKHGDFDYEYIAMRL
jgi:hypothetical protein